MIDLFPSLESQIAPKAKFKIDVSKDCESPTVKQGLSIISDPCEKIPVLWISVSVKLRKGWRNGSNENVPAQAVQKNKYVWIGCLGQLFPTLRTMHL